MTKVEIPLLDIEIYRGDDTELDIKMTQKDKSPIDLTGYTFTMLIKPKNGDAYLLEEGKGITVFHSEGAVKLTFSHELSKEWLFTTAQYDLQGKSSTGQVRTFVRGSISVIKDITP